METISDSFLITYLIIMGLTLIASTICYALGVHMTLSVIALILSLAIPLINLIFSSQRSGELNGYEYLITQFKGKDLWAIFIVAGYAYLLVWWIFFINKLLRKYQFFKWLKETFIKLRGRLVELWKKKFPKQGNNDE